MLSLLAVARRVALELGPWLAFVDADLRQNRQMTIGRAMDWWKVLGAEAPSGLEGLWFGLVQLSDGGWHIYVAGTATFDADDENADWAVGPYAWWPETPDRYFPFPQADTDSIEDALDAAADFVRDLAPWATMPVRGVATGFDAGDFRIVSIE